MIWPFTRAKSPEEIAAEERENARRRLAKEASGRQRREANAHLAETLSHVIGDAVDSVRELGRRHNGGD